MRVSAMIRYVYPTIATTNFGDYVIDYATRRLLKEFLCEPAAACDTYAGEYPEGEYDCLVIPGITHLTRGACPGLEAVSSLPYPTFCLAGNIWQRREDRGILLRTRVVHVRSRTAPDLTVARMMQGPVGARDPYTYSLLSESGVRSLYTGCATLLLPPDDVGDDGYVLFSLGRGRIRTQTRAASRLSRKYPVIGICHELQDAAAYRAAGWTLPLVSYRQDVELYLSYFRRASVVVTGRLHGALPSLAFGKRVFVFGDRDSRTSILDDLGVTVHPSHELPEAVERASASFNRALLSVYRRNWAALCGAIKEHVDTQRRSTAAKTERLFSPR
jgi:hypothetical protein